MPHSPSDRVSVYAVWRRFLFALISTGLAISVIVAVIYRQDILHQRALLQQEARHVLNLQQEFLQFELRAVQSDLLYLSTQDMLSRFVSGDATAKDDLEAEYVNFARNKAIYDQVRVLDTTGMEIIRINYRNGQATVVQPEQLQSKATRYYFRQGMSLEIGEVFVSPFDLNVEHGRIQRPIQPVIRFVTPARDGAQTRGLVVLNYVGARLISQLKQIAAGFRGETMLLNPAGEYLLASDPSREWGWLLGHDHSFRSEFPLAWDLGKRLGTGQFRVERNLFTFRSVSPGRRSRPETAPGTTNAGSLDPSSLLLVSYVSAAAETAHSRSLLTQLMAMYVGVMAVVAAPLFYWARSREIRKLHEQRLVDSESRLRKLSTLLLAAQENERRSLSRDLHDELGQQVTAIGLDLRSIAKEMGTSRSSPLLERTIAQTDHLLKCLHEVAERVRPSVLDDLGLHEAVNSYLSEFQQRTGITVTSQLWFRRENIPARIGENVYRILQEALANVAAHAQVDQATVTIETDTDMLQMTIEDRGVGFEPAILRDTKRLGILGMRERVDLLNGEFRLQSHGGAGTQIFVAIPLDEEN